MGVLGWAIGLSEQRESTEGALTRLELTDGREVLLDVEFDLVARVLRGERAPVNPFNRQGPGLHLAEKTGWLSIGPPASDVPVMLPPTALMAVLPWWGDEEDDDVEARDGAAVEE